jgi:hypothetical protein
VTFSSESSPAVILSTGPGISPTVSGYSIGDPGRAGVEVRPTAVTRPIAWPDTVVDAISLPTAEVRAASVRGILHRDDGTPRQDCYAVSADDGGIVVAVCDGVGSLPLSHQAAYRASVDAVAGVRRYLREGGVGWAEVFTEVSDGLLVLEDSLRAGQSEHNRLLATTLLLGMLRPSGDADWQLELAWRGDSTPFLLRHGGEWIALDPQVIEIDESAGLVTRLGNSVSALPTGHPTQFKSVTLTARPGDAAFLMTDGVGKPMGSGAGLVGKALAEWWREPPPMLTFADQVGFARRGYTDDRTVVGVWFRSPAQVTEP